MLEANFMGRGDNNMLLKCNGSSSSGNGYALIEDDEILLLECGVPAKEMLKSIDYQTSKVVGCLLTHEHSDHSKCIKQYMQYGIKVYTSNEVHTGISTIYGENTRCMNRMRKERIGSLTVTPFRVHHNDTECDGFFIETKSKERILFITDAEYCPYNFSKMGINHAMIECNYSNDYINKIDDCGNMDHVLHGHMELETCKRLIRSINSCDLRSVGLLHLSLSNGNPVRFSEEIENIVDCDVDVWIANNGIEKELSFEPF